MQPKSIYADRTVGRDCYYHTATKHNSSGVFRGEALADTAIACRCVFDDGAA